MTKKFKITEKQLLQWEQLVRNKNKSCEDCKYTTRNLDIELDIIATIRNNSLGKKTKKLNINDIVEVKLTKYGNEILNEHFGVNKTFCDFKDGYFQTTIWELMDIFGTKIRSDQLFESNEILVVKE